MAAGSRNRRRAILLVGGMLLSVSWAEAQMGTGPGGMGPSGPFPPPAIGARGGLDWDERNWSLGGQARFILPFLPVLECIPSGDVFFLEERKQWQINIDAALQILPFAYTGGGLAVAFDSLPTSSGPTVETGYNLFIGFNIPARTLPVIPFAEARWTMINRFVQPFRTVVGVNVPLGRQPDRRR